MLLLLLLQEEIWRPETPVLKFLHMCVQKKNSTAENYPTMPFIKQRSNAVIKSGHEVQSNCNSVLQRTKTSSKTDYNKIHFTNSNK
jgi:hypothetical protein